MSDNLRSKQPQDASRINLHESWEVNYWTNSLGISKGKLEEAVNAVGVSATKVKEWLKEH